MTQKELNDKLIRAVMVGTEDDVLNAIGDGGDLFVKDIKGNSLLVTAAYKRNFETFDTLLKITVGGKGIDLNEQNNFNRNVIMEIIESNSDMEFVKKVVAAGADVNAYNAVVLPPLMYALAHEEIDLFNLLIEAGANVNVKLAETGTTPLLMLTTASTTKDMHVMAEKLIDLGADVNAQDRNGRTPLMNLKLRSKSFMKKVELDSAIKTEKLLIENPNFNVNITDVGGADSLFYYMSEAELTDNVLKLIELGAKLDVWQDIFLAKNVKTSTAHLLMSAVTRMSHDFEPKTKEEKKAALANQNTKNNNQQKAPQSPNGWGIGAGMSATAALPTEEESKIPKTTEGIYQLVMDLFQQENIDLTKENTLGNSIAGIALTGSVDFVTQWLNDSKPIANKIYSFDRQSAEEKETLLLNLWVKRPNSTEIIKELISRGIQITYNGQDIIKDEEPLFTAMSSLNLNIVNELLNAGVNPNIELKISKDSEYFSPLRIFAQGIVDGNFNKALSELYQQKNLKKAYEENEINGIENTILTREKYEKICENIEALEKVSEEVERLRMQTLNELISFGADINLVDKNNRTPIFYSSDEKTYELLKSFGADIFAENENGENYLMYLLAHTNKPEILKLVFNEYVELDHPLGVKPFYEIAFNEKAVDSHNMTECLIANMQMLLSEENQKALLDNRKLVALKDNLERVSKRLDVQKEPTDYGVNQKLIDSLEKDVLELTKKIEEIGEPKIVYDERINYQDENGNSPLLIACAMNNNRFAKFFLELGADINMENIMKETPIMHAIATDDVNLVKFLIEKGADVQRVNAENKSVLDFAKEIDNKEILEEVMRALDPTIEEGKISNRRAYRF